MYCPNCGKQVEENVKFCGECGCKIDDNEQQNKAELASNNEQEQLTNQIIEKETSLKEKVCPSCQNVCATDSDFCNKCGTKLIQEKYCPNCGWEYTDEDVFCKKCGTNLKNNAIQSSPKEKILKCSKCNSEYNEGDTYCGICGNDLTANKNNENYPVEIKHKPKIIRKIYINRQDDDVEIYENTYRCPYCGSTIQSKKLRKCPYCGEWLKVSHFGCGSLLLLLSVIYCIYLACSGHSIGSLSGGILILVGILYFIPSLIAEMRGHESQDAIFILNLFLGWTLLGWLICLIWSFGGRSR